MKNIYNENRRALLIDHFQKKVQLKKYKRSGKEKISSISGSEDDQQTIKFPKRSAN
ncbi:hypothetical protein LD112_02525 [Pantoea agglomerans]|nr:hypothetical protein [Pantoea agglomerans]